MKTGRRLERAVQAGIAIVMALHPGVSRADPATGETSLAIASNAPHARSNPPASPAPRGLWPADERAAVLIAHAERKVATAHFDEALVLTGRARELLAPYGRKQRALRHKADLEVAAATAFVALDRKREAIACFRRALSVEPELELEVASTSPKVLRVFREARSAR